MTKAPVRARATYHHGDLRRALLDATLAVIESDGPASFTLREVARRVGVTHRAAYRHFADKDALLALVAAQGFRALTEAMRAAIVGVPDDDLEQQLSRISAAYVAFAGARPSYFVVMTGRYPSGPERPVELTAASDEAFEFLLEVMRSASERGLLRDGLPRDHAVRFWVFTHGYASLVLNGWLPVAEGQRRAYFDSLMRPVLEGFSRAR